LTAIPALCHSQAIDIEAEKAVIRQVIDDSIGWAAKDKDTDLLFSVIAHDPELLILSPTSAGTIAGWEEFVKITNEFWLNDAFKATHHEIRDLRIVLSQSGTVAWFSCELDDLGEWKGEPIGWKDCRWTGVLEKRDGKWVAVQMHFSFAADRLREEGDTEEQ
jgi:hypothetical protein